MGRIFCPQCGNAALDKVEVVISGDGQEQFGVRKRHILRGTRFSLPKPAVSALGAPCRFWGVLQVLCPQAGTHAVGFCPQVLVWYVAWIKCVQASGNILFCCCLPWEQAAPRHDTAWLCRRAAQTHRHRQRGLMHRALC